MNEKTVLAIDPGTSKCGMALVRRDEKGHLDLIWRRIASTRDLMDAISEAGTVHRFDLIIVGGGTFSNQVISTIRSESPGNAILVVDEKETTLQARERYWVHNKRRGWRRLLPSTLQEPPDPVDDFVALILAERVLLHS